MPRFVDIDPLHWHIDPERLAEALDAGGDDVAIVLGCSAFGTPPPAAVRDAWTATCAEHGVALLVDSAAGFGALAEDGVPVGAQGAAEVVSFHATKPFAVGEGGAIFSRDPAIVEHAEAVTNFGLAAGRRLVAPLALNAKMSEAQAATALAVLDSYDAVLAARRAAAEQLRGALAGAGTFQAGCERSTWQFVPLALADPAARARCLAISGEHVELRTYYDPLHRVDGFPHAPGQPPLPVTDALADRMVSLPMANDLSADELDVIAREVLRGVGERRRPARRGHARGVGDRGGAAGGRRARRHRRRAAGPDRPGTRARGRRRARGGRRRAGLSVHYQRIISQAEIDRYAGGVCNLHPGLLPWGRGFYPVFWALWERTPAGATLHEVVAALDAGPVVDQIEVEVRADDTGGSLHARVQAAEQALFARWWPRLAGGAPLPAAPQARDHGSAHDRAEFFALKREGWRALGTAELERLERCLRFPGYSGVEGRDG